MVYEVGHRDFYLENRKNPAKWGCTEEQLTSSFINEGFEVLRCEGVAQTGDWDGETTGKRLKFGVKKL